MENTSKIVLEFTEISKELVSYIRHIYIKLFDSGFTLETEKLNRKYT